MEHEVNEKQSLTVRTGAQGGINQGPSTGFPTGARTIWFIGIDEAPGGSASLFKVNDAADDTFDGTYGAQAGSGPLTTDTSTFAFEIGGSGGAELTEMTGTRYSICICCC